MRTLKLNLLADVDKFGKGMGKAGTDVHGFGGKVKQAGKIAAGAFAAVAAAAGAMAIKLGVDAVNAAAEDEQSQALLAKALQNVTGATKDQIKANEDYIKGVQLKTGLSDTAQRKGITRLIRSTKDITEAQKLNNLAVEIAAGTGKNYEDVVNALAKANDGNFKALKKLGITIGDNASNAADLVTANNKLNKAQTDLKYAYDNFGISSKEYVKAQEKVADAQTVVNDVSKAGVDWVGELGKEFAGSASTAANTFSGQLAILKQYFGEIQEDIGAKLIPKFKLLLENIVLVAKGFSREDPQGLTARARELAGEYNGNGASSLGGSIRALADSFGKLFQAITNDGDPATNTLTQFANSVEKIAGAVDSLATNWGKLVKVGKFITAGSPLRLFLSGSEGFQFNGYKPQGNAAGGSVSANTPVRVGEFGSEIFVPSGSGSIRKDPGSGGVTIVINGAVDPNGTRRQLEQLFKTSSRQLGLVTLNGARL
jgi:hypothetical protein